MNNKWRRDNRIWWTPRFLLGCKTLLFIDLQYSFVQDLIVSAKLYFTQYEEEDYGDEEGGYDEEGYGDYGEEEEWDEEEEPWEEEEEAFEEEPWQDEWADGGMAGLSIFTLFFHSFLGYAHYQVVFFHFFALPFLF